MPRRNQVHQDPDPFLEPYQDEQEFSLCRQVSQVFQFLLGYFALIVGLVVIIQHRELRDSSVLLFNYIIYTLVAEFALFGATCLIYICQVCCCREERIAYCYPIFGLALQFCSVIISFISLFMGIFFLYAYMHPDSNELWSKLAETERKIYPIIIYIISIVMLSSFTAIATLPYIWGIIKIIVEKAIHAFHIGNGNNIFYTVLDDNDYHAELEEYAKDISTMKHPYIEFSDRVHKKDTQDFQVNS